jgi:spermidine synthase
MTAKFAHNAPGIDALIDRSSARRLQRAGRGSAALEVYEDGRYRWLQNGNGTLQSLMDRNSAERLVLPYTVAMMAALLFVEAPESVLMLGLGGASQLRFLRHHVAPAGITVIESNADVIAIARRYFALPAAGAGLRVVNADARAGIPTDDPAADLILLDLFTAGGMPNWLREPALHQRCRQRLSAQGVLAANLWVDSDDELLQVMDGVQTAFEQRTLVLDVPGYRNLVVLAFNNTPRLDFASLTARARGLGARTGLDYPTLLRRMRASNLSDDSGFLIGLTCPPSPRNP